MKEVRGDIWNYYPRCRPEGNKAHDWMVFTGNGSVKANGNAVLGRGVAFEVSMYFPRIPYELGTILRYSDQLKVHLLPKYGLIFFPVKWEWSENADPRLIYRSARQLRSLFPIPEQKIYMVRPGCGNGNLEWPRVKKIINQFLHHDNFIVVDKNVGYK